MANNQAVLLTILGLFTILGLNLVAWNYRKNVQKLKADSLERSIGLAIPDDMRASIGQRLARTRRMSLVGLVLGAWAVVPLIWPATGAIESGNSIGLVLLGASLGGGAIGTAISSVKWSARRDTDEVRYARARAVNLTDYVSPLERRLAWVAIAIAALIFLTSLVFPAAAGSLLSPQPLAGAVWLAFAVASLCFFEVFGRRIVNRPQPMASEPELVWDDALRSQEIRDLVGAPITIGVYGLFVSGISLLENIGTALDPGAASMLVNGVSILCVILVIALAVWITAARPERYFLKRLWPQYGNVAAPSPLNAGGATSDSAS